MQTAAAQSPPDGWDAYVASHPLGTAYHRVAAVQIGKAVFGLQTWFISTSQDGRLVGVVPLVLQSSPLFGRFLVSVPFFTYGGVLADTDSAAAALLQEVIRLGKELRVDHVELRHRSAEPAFALPQRNDKVSMVLPLAAQPDEMGKRLGSKLRSQIRRADRESPQICWGGAELLPEYYEVFAGSMHRLGTPVYPRRFFEHVLAAFGSLLQLLVVRVRGEAQAAAILIRHGSRIEVPWAATTAESKHYSLNMRMYWELLLQSMAAGATEFDFGRSTIDSGTYQFKRQWGAQPQQLHWHYWMASGAPLPQLNQSNRVYGLASEVWRRMPRSLADRLGPWIIRHLP